MHQIELLAISDLKTNGMSVCLKPRIPYIITTSLVHEIRKLQNKIAEQYYTTPWEGIYYIFWYLHSDKIPWKGFDFNFIHHAFIRHNEQHIERYIEDIFEILFINYVGLGLPLINCSIVHRRLSGISQDFFYLNRLNFLNRSHEFNCECFNKLPFSKLDFNSEIKKTSFPQKIYTRNCFYTFESIDLNSMRKIISSYHYTPIPTTQQNEIKRIFNEKMQKTIEELYQLASENMDLIKHFALIQSMRDK